MAAAGYRVVKKLNAKSTQFLRQKKLLEWVANFLWLRAYCYEIYNAKIN
jgi:hypothetical protein